MLEFVDMIMALFLLCVLRSTKNSLKVKVLVTQSCPILCDPMDCSLPGPSVHEIFQVRIREWVALPFSRGIFPTQELNLDLVH